MKIQKKKKFRGVGGGGGHVRGGGIRVDVNKELKVFVKIQEKNFFFLGGGGSGKGGGGVRVDVNEELKFL